MKRGKVRPMWLMRLKTRERERRYQWQEAFGFEYLLRRRAGDSREAILAGKIGGVMPATEALIMPRINALADRAGLKASVDWAEEYETHEQKHWL